jgi:D-galacturonate reductase
MKYTPSDGHFSGQNGYGYVSFEKFVDAAASINSGQSHPSDYDGLLPTVGTTFCTTAILEAGRLSLDNNSRPVQITYDSAAGAVPTGVVLV